MKGRRIRAVLRKALPVMGIVAMALLSMGQSGGFCPISSPPPPPVSTQPPDGFVGVPYSFLVGPGATGGTTDAPGMSASYVGFTGVVLSGTPSRAGVFTVRFFGAGATQSFTVHPGVAVGPQSATIAAGQTQQFSAHRVDDLRTDPITWPTITQSVVWSSAHPNIATMSGTPGLATGVAPSAVPARIVATSASGASGTANLTVTAAPNVALNCPAPAQGNAVVGQTFQSHYECTDGDRPFTYTLRSGDFDANGQGRNACSGLVLTRSTSGVDISGTPTTAGMCSAEIEAQDSGTPPETATAVLAQLVRQALQVSPQTIPDGTENLSYSAALQVTPASGPVNFALSSGALPPGIALNPNGTFSGTPTVGGVFSFTVAAADANQTANFAFEIRVLSIQTQTLPGGTVGQPYSQALTAVGDRGALSWQVLVGNPPDLPPGLTLSPLGVISGIPTQPGSFQFIVEVSDAAPPGRLDIQVLRIDVAPSNIAVSVTASPTTLGVNQTAQLTATVANDSGLGVTWSVNGIPGGDATVGTIATTSPSGASVTYAPPATPPPGGSVTITAASRADPTKSAATTITLLQPLQIAAGPVTDGSANVNYSAAINASGGSGNVVFTVLGGSQTLPPGLTLNPDPQNPTGALLSGTPTTGGSFTFTVEARDQGTGEVALRSYVVLILEVNAAPLSGGIVNKAYNHTVTALGLLDPTNAQWSSSGLPSGLQIDLQTGEISGTPTQTGSFPVTVTVTEGARSDSHAFTLEIADPVALIFAAGRGGVTSFGVNAAGNVTRLVKALADADATGVAVDGDVLAVTFSNGTLVTARINPNATLTKLDVAQNLGEVSNPRFHQAGTSNLRLYLIRKDPAVTIDAYTVNGATGQMQQIQGAPFVTGVPAGSVSFNIDQANGQIILHSPASTFIIAHVLDTTGRVSAGAPTFDTTFYAAYTAFSSGVHGAAGKKSGEVEIYVFDPNTTLPQSSPITSVFLNSPISGIESHPTQVCAAVNTDLGGGTRKTMIHLDSLSGAASATSSADLGFKLGHGVMVVGGTDASAATLQGFAVNTQAGPFDLAVFGFAPVAIGAGSGSCALAPSITGSGQTFDGGAVEVAAFPLFPAPATNAPAVSVGQSCVGGVCNFVAIPTVDTSLELAGVWFDFEGDGTFDAFGTSTSHTYATSGTFQMVVRVIDSSGRRSETTVPVTVTVTLPQAPVASLTANCVQRTCTFSAAGSTDADGSIVTYTWEFGDGNGATGVNASHTYATDGTFTVRLTVTDNVGLTHSVTQQVTVNAPPSAGPITDILLSKGDGTTFSAPFVAFVRHDEGADTLTVQPPAVQLASGQPGPIAGDNQMLVVADNRTLAPANDARVLIYTRDAANNWILSTEFNVPAGRIRSVVLEPQRRFIWLTFSMIVSGGVQEHLGVYDVAAASFRTLAPSGWSPRETNQLLMNPNSSEPFIYSLARNAADVSGPEDLTVLRYFLNGNLQVVADLNVPFPNVMRQRGDALYVGANDGTQYVVRLANGMPAGVTSAAVTLGLGGSGLFGEAAFAKTVTPPNFANVCKYTLADVDKILMMEVNDQTPSLSAPTVVGASGTGELFFGIEGHPTRPFLYVFGDAPSAAPPPVPQIPLPFVAAYEVNQATCALTFRTRVTLPLPPGPLNSALLLPQ